MMVFGLNRINQHPYMFDVVHVVKKNLTLNKKDMPFINYKSKPMIKIWDGIFGQIHHSNTITCAHISIKAGVQLPQHSHVHEQWSHLLQGEMEFTVGDETRVIKAGETAYVPSHVPHSARTIGDCQLIDVFSPVREDWVALEKQQQNP